MKKILPLLFIASFGLIIPSISNTVNIAPVNAEEGTITTHLVLTENGLYNGEKGEKNPDLYLENAVSYVANPGDDLPGSDIITSSVSGVTFKGWITYNGLGVPEGVTKVSSIDNEIVYASWEHDGSSTPGGDTGGSGGDVTGETMTVYLRAPENWSQAYIYCWPTGGSGLAEWPGSKMSLDTDTGLFYYAYDTARYDNVIFSNGEGIQSTDLKSPTSEDADCYVWNNGWYNEDTTELPPIPEESATLYLKVNNNWKKDNARFAAYFFGSGEVWVSMTLTSTTDIYEVEVPEGYVKVIFCRMSGANQTNNWNNKWNQTGDLNIPTDGKNMYIVPDGAWDGSGNTGWSTYPIN